MRVPSSGLGLDDDLGGGLDDEEDFDTPFGGGDENPIGGGDPMGDDGMMGDDDDPMGNDEGMGDEPLGDDDDMMGDKDGMDDDPMGDDEDPIGGDDEMGGGDDGFMQKFNQLSKEDQVAVEKYADSMLDKSEPMGDGMPTESRRNFKRRISEVFGNEQTRSDKKTDKPWQYKDDENPFNVGI